MDYLKKLAELQLDIVKETWDSFKAWNTWQMKELQRRVSNK